MAIVELRERLQIANNKAHDIRSHAEAEKRDLTTQEAADLDNLLNESDRIELDIERLGRLEDQTDRLTKSNGRKTSPDQPQPQVRADGSVDEPAAASTLSKQNLPRISAVPRDLTAFGNGGFRSLGDMAFHVARSCKQGGVSDQRLERLAAATVYGNESSGSDGGFAVPPDFRTEIMRLITGEDTLLSRCDQINTAGNTFTQPVDESTPWQTSGGIQAFWTGEGEAKSQSKPVLGERTVKLNKLTALVPMTDELLEDAPGMDSYLRRKAPEKIQFKINWAIINGTGVGMPLGILNSPATVTVSKAASQTAATLTGGNVIAMYSRMYGPNRPQAVWIYNQEIEPQLYKLSVPGTDAVGNAVTGWGSAVYMPPGGLSGAPYGTLFGRPAIPTQAASALGTKGDIIFADLSQYLALLKSGINPKVDISIHLWFDQDITAFRFVLRMGGIPWWSTAVSALNGSTTYSPFVTLEARA